MTTTGKSLEFCPHLSRAIRDGKKVTTWKPISAAELAKLAADPAFRPFAIGAVCQIMEPWGKALGKDVFSSSFSEAFRIAKPPPRFVPMPGLRSEVGVTITACEVRKLSTITESDAIKAGTIPVDPDTTFRAAFERQWKSAYGGAQAWDADPSCWVISFQLVLSP